MLESTLDLPVEDTISWQDFVQLRLVRDLVLANPTMQIIDITPQGMADSFTQEQQRLINAENSLEE